MIWRKDSVWKIITENLDMWKGCTKMALKLLNDDQKGCHMQEGQGVIECLQTELDLIWSVINGEEMYYWVWPLNQEPEPSVKVTDIAEAKESKTKSSWLCSLKWGTLSTMSFCHWTRKSICQSTSKFSVWE